MYFGYHILTPEISQLFLFILAYLFVTVVYLVHVGLFFQNTLSSHTRKSTGVINMPYYVSIAFIRASSRALVLHMLRHLMAQIHY